MIPETIRNYMTQNPKAIGRHRTLAAAHELMRRNRIRHLPVLEEGRLVGIVSEGDLHLFETLQGVDPDLEAVEEAMTPDPYAVDPDASVEDVSSVMAKHKYGSAVVVEKGRVVGIFTTTDALRALDGLLKRVRG